MKKNYTKKDLERIEILKELKKDLKNKKIIATVKSVSRSGMSRIITFNYYNKKHYLYNIDYKISKLLNYRLTDHGVSVGGCGMDMIFHVLYSINSLAINYGVIKKSAKKSKHDLYYNGLVNTNYKYL